MCSLMEVMKEVKEALLSTTKIQINKLFTGEKSICFKFENEDIELNYCLTKNQVSTLLRMAVFHLLQFYEKDSLIDENSHNCRIIIISLLHIAKDLDDDGNTFLKECGNFIFRNPSVLSYFLPVYKKKALKEQTFTDIFLEICEVLRTFIKCWRKDCNVDKSDNENDKNNENDGVLQLYKEKFISLIKTAVEKCKTKEKTKLLVKVEFFKILEFDETEMVDLLQTILELPFEKFLSSNKTRLSIWGIVVPNLLNTCLEKRSTSKNVFPLEKQILKKLFAILTALKASKLDVLLWEESLFKYLQRFPHNIESIDKGTFTALLQNETNSETIKLISLIINRNMADIPQFLKFTKKDDSILKECNTIFSILGNNLTYNWDKQFLSKLCEFHKSEIVTFITENQNTTSWIQKNVAAVIYLIESTFDSQTCQEICNFVLVNGDKLIKVDTECIQLVESCFKKVKMYKEFVQVLVHLLASTLKSCKSKTALVNNKKKLEFSCRKLTSTIEILKKDDTFFYEELSKSHSWPQFVRFSLSQCLKLEEETSFDHTLLLKAFISACDVAYTNNGNDEYVNTIFGLTTSHSQYVEIMLSSSIVKRYLVELLLILIRKNRSLMLPNHIPVYLSAYNATLSETDQILFMILKEYENSNIDLGKYRPFLWGNAAALHYSIDDDPNHALWNQPKTSQILDLFVLETVNNTITKFPVERTLKMKGLHAAESVYDPAFYLPVLCEILSAHNPVAYHRVTHSGAFALMLIACCSKCDLIRQASFTGLSRFYLHLENLDFKRSDERRLWTRFIDALRNGITELGTPIEEVRLNGFVATFLAKSSIIGTQPLHPLYCPLHKLFMAKPALKLNTIPEFKKLFHSTEVDYEAHRTWILEVIRDGFRSENDLQIAINSSVFNILLSFYVSSLSDKPTRKLILEIINSAAKIPKSACLLVNYYGLIPWLDSVTERLESSDFDFVPLLVDVIKNFFDSFMKRNMKDRFSLLVLLQMLLTLKAAMKPKFVPVSCFTTYLNILENILHFKGVYLPENEIMDLLKLAKEVLGDIRECEDLLMFGSEFASNETDILEDPKSVACRSFRKLILRYQSSKKIVNKSKIQLN